VYREGGNQADMGLDKGKASLSRKRRSKGKRDERV
jgi:hypothetical protein